MIKGLFSTANILQITGVVLGVVLLFLLCVYPAVGLFLFLETCKMFRDFVLGFRGVVHFSAINAVLLTSFSTYQKRLYIW